MAPDDDDDSIFMPLFADLSCPDNMALLSFIMIIREKTKNGHVKYSYTAGKKFQLS